MAAAAEPRGRESVLRLAVPYLVMTALVGVDLVTGRDEPFAGTLGVAAVTAAVLSGPGVTAVAAVASVVVSVLLGTWEETDFQAAATRTFIVALVGVGAVALSSYERRRDADFAQVQAVAVAAQRAVLRPVPTAAAGVSVAARYVSASRLAEVGGDFYEVVPCEHGARLVVGDVRGKGLQSVSLAAVALGVFREAAATEPTLAAVAARLDHRMRGYLEEEDFVTVVLGELHPGPDGEPVLRLLSCGHPPPLLVRDDRVQTVPLASRPPLGLGEVDAWGEDVVGDGSTEIALRPGDRVLAYTDGLVEARDVHREFVPLEDLIGALRPSLGLDPDQALLELLARLRERTGGPLGDDLALLLLHRP